MRPQLSATTSNRVFIGYQRFAAIAAMVGAQSIDVDFTGWNSFPRSRPRITASDGVASPGSLVIDPENLTRLDTLVSQTNWLRHASGTTELIVRLPEMGGQRGDQKAASTASTVLQSRSHFTSAVLLTPATAVEGGRTHLARLHALKRLAEEWELAIGLDFCDRTDARWEAEAALHIIGSRLALVRIKSNVHDPRRASSEVTVRALKAASDERFAGRVSIVPALPLWRSWSAAALAREMFMARELVTRIFLGLPFAATLPTDAPIQYR